MTFGKVQLEEMARKHKMEETRKKEAVGFPCFSLALFLLG